MILINLSCNAFAVIIAEQDVLVHCEAMYKKGAPPLFFVFDPNRLLDSRDTKINESTVYFVPSIALIEG